MARKLHEALAIRKGKKSQNYNAVTERHKLNKKAPLFAGLQRKYISKIEGGEEYPPESVRVQHNVRDSLALLRALTSELWDCEYTVDAANQKATCSIVIDGQEIAANVPVTTLMALGKQLADVRTYIDDLPELDQSEEWVLDKASGLWRSETRVKHRTTKVQRAIVLVDATEHHPAQAQLISEDVVVGHWHEQKLAGGISFVEKRDILTRLDKLTESVKTALTRANETPAPPLSIGSQIFNYVLGA